MIADMARHRRRWERLRCRADAPTARPEPCAGAGADVDRAAAGRIASDDRPAGAAGSPGAGFAPGVDQQQHRQPALVERDRLARVRRADERRREILREDPAGVHAAMEFATRDAYRHATEQIARRSALSESKSLPRPSSSRRGSAIGPPPRSAHCACRLLPDRRGVAAAGTRGRHQASLFDVAARIWASVPRADLSRDRSLRSPCVTSTFTRGHVAYPPGDEPNRWRCRVARTIAALSLGDQSARGGHRQLVRDAAGKAALVATDGLQRRHRTAARTLVAVPTLLTDARAWKT